MDAETKRYHPLYSSPDADLVLLSTDGLKFRVHSFIMSMASENPFGDMLEIGRDEQEGIDDAVPMYEASDVVQAILAIIYPNQAFPAIGTCDFASRLLSTAEKFHMHKVTSAVRSVIMNHPHFRISQPLELYLMATRYGFDEEAKLALTAVLDVNLTSPTHFETLKKFDVESLLKLQSLHHRRKEALFAAMDPYTLSGVLTYCPSDLEGRGHNVAMLKWRLLRFRVAEEMEKCSSGKTLRETSLWISPEFDDLFGSECPNCHNFPFTRQWTYTAVLLALNKLPVTL